MNIVSIILLSIISVAALLSFIGVQGPAGALLVVGGITLIIAAGLLGFSLYKPNNYLLFAVALLLVIAITMQIVAIKKMLQLDANGVKYKNTYKRAWGILIITLLSSVGGLITTSVILLQGKKKKPQPQQSEQLQPQPQMKQRVLGGTEPLLQTPKDYSVAQRMSLFRTT